MWKALTSVNCLEKINVDIACNIHPQDRHIADAEHNFLQLRKILKSATR